MARASTDVFHGLQKSKILYGLNKIKERDSCMSERKYKIQKGSVQETLLIPLYGRKLAMDMYPGLFSDRDAQKLFEQVGIYFSVEHEQELKTWSSKLKEVVHKGYMTGYRPLDKRYGWIENLVFKLVDKTRKCQMIEISFEE